MSRNNHQLPWNKICMMSVFYSLEGCVNRLRHGWIAGVSIEDTMTSGGASRVQGNDSPYFLHPSAECVHTSTTRFALYAMWCLHSQTSPNSVAPLGPLVSHPRYALTLSCMLLAKLLLLRSDNASAQTNSAGLTMVLRYWLSCRHGYIQTSSRWTMSPTVHN